MLLFRSARKSMTSPVYGVKKELGFTFLLNSTYRNMSLYEVVHIYSSFTRVFSGNQGKGWHFDGIFI